MTASMFRLSVICVWCSLLFFGSDGSFFLKGKEILLAELESKLDRLENNVERIDGQVQTLQDKEDEETDAAPLYPITFAGASRENTSNGTRFTVSYRHLRNVNVVMEYMLWKITPRNELTGEFEKPYYEIKRVNNLKTLGSDQLLSTNITVQRRGLLSAIPLQLTSEKFRFTFMASLSLNNLDTKDASQYRIPGHHFAVTSPDPLLYWGEENPVLEVTVQGPKRLEVLSSMAITIQYLNEGNSEKEVSEKTCHLKDETDTVCASILRAEYRSSKKIAITIKTSKILPVGVSRISTIKELRGELVTKVELTTLVSIRPLAAAENYPAGVNIVEMLPPVCVSDTCDVSCKIYGEAVYPQLSRGERKEKLTSGLINSTSMTGSSITSTWSLKRRGKDVKAENVTCTGKPSGSDISMSRTMTIIYQDQFTPGPHL
ncbi:uncharacterized protein LOC101861904 [Aplysia californica]|uniref:Uncharacterized protein LOC101861904 n=1 Tax=Aplysia californica TaxID=6500 RepID=A0ABM0JXX3_APLCA|nr:uncharacterized protein LOC101861904 [Aplysia californica]